MRRVLWFCRIYALNDAGEMGVDSDVQNSAGGLSGTFWREQHGYAEDVTGIKKLLFSLSCAPLGGGSFRTARIPVFHSKFPKPGVSLQTVQDLNPTAVFLQVRKVRLSYRFSQVSSPSVVSPQL